MEYCNDPNYFERKIEEVSKNTWFVLIFKFWLFKLRHQTPLFCIRVANYFIELNSNHESREVAVLCGRHSRRSLLHPHEWHNPQRSQNPKRLALEAWGRLRGFWVSNCESVWLRPLSCDEAGVQREGTHGGEVWHRRLHCPWNPKQKLTRRPRDRYVGLRSHALRNVYCLQANEVAEL